MNRCSKQKKRFRQNRPEAREVEKCEGMQEGRGNSSHKRYSRSMNIQMVGTLDLYSRGSSSLPLDEFGQQTKVATSIRVKLPWN